MLIKIRKGLLFFSLAKPRSLSTAAEERVLLFSRKGAKTQRNLNALCLLLLGSCLPVGRQASFLSACRRPLRLRDFARLSSPPRRILSQRRGAAKKSNRSFAPACLPPSRYFVQSFFLLFARKVAKPQRKVTRHLLLCSWYIIPSTSFPFLGTLPAARQVLGTSYNPASF